MAHSEARLPVPSRLPFMKLHGAGNDFVLIDARKRLPYRGEELAKAICDRHFGVGADGLILLEPSAGADYRMSYFNPDGTRSVCGNGVRCLARFILALHIIPRVEQVLDLETDHGIVHAEILGRGERVRVDMGAPMFEAGTVPIRGRGEQLNIPLQALGQEFLVSAVGMGNPHCVVFVPSLAGVDVTRIGPALEHHEVFPEKANVEFVEVLDRGRVQLRVWERGVGETLACGSGACAVIAAGVRTDRLDRVLTLRYPGGEFQATWSPQSDHIVLTGPAEEVFTGEIDAARLLEMSKLRGGK